MRYNVRALRVLDIMKKVIYLDQFVVSEMMKALNPRHPSHERILRETPYWLTLFKKLDHLLKLHLIVSPNSLHHDEESMVAPYFNDLKRIYEHLADEKTFHDYETIVRFQIHEHLENYLSGQPATAPDIPRERVIMGDLDGWMDRVRVSVNVVPGDDQVAEVREARDARYEGLKKVFLRWQSDRKTFDEMVLEEAVSFGQASFQSCVAYEQRKRAVLAGRMAPDLENILPPTAVLLLTEIFGTIRDHGYRDGVLAKAKEYFTSKHILAVPYIRISSMLLASIARKAGAGQVKPPSRGTFTDVNVISSVMPYCDAIFVDNEYGAYIQELGDELDYGTAVFSNNTRDEFLAYLDQIEVMADPKHLRAVRERYGEGWEKPYVEILREPQ
jgi:hypothetical protein